MRRLQVYGKPCPPVGDIYPLPTVDQLFAKLAGCQKFSQLDLEQAYH